MNGLLFSGNTANDLICVFEKPYDYDQRCIHNFPFTLVQGGINHDETFIDDPKGIISFDPVIKNFGIIEQLVGQGKFERKIISFEFYLAEYSYRNYFNSYITFNGVNYLNTVGDENGILYFNQ